MFSRAELAKFVSGMFESHTKFVLSDMFRIILGEMVLISEITYVPSSDEDLLRLFLDRMDFFTDEMMSKLLTLKIVYFFSDNSGSVEGHGVYADIVLENMNDFIESDEYGIIIPFFWNSTTKNVSFSDFEKNCNSRYSEGGTTPSSICPFLPPHEILGMVHLVIITDGQTSAYEAEKIHDFIKTKYNDLKVAIVTTLIINTGGSIDLTCVAAFERFGVIVSRWIYRKDDYEPSSVIKGSLEKLCAKISAISTIAEFESTSGPLLKEICLFFQGIPNGDETVKLALIQLKARLTKSLSSESLSSEGFDNFQRLRLIIDSHLLEEIPMIVDLIMRDHFEKSIDWNSVLARMIEITNGTLKGKYSLKAGIDGMIGPKADTLEECSKKELLELGLDEANLDEANLDGLPICIISFEQDIPLCPLGENELFPSGTNLSGYTRNALTLLGLILSKLLPFMPYFGIKVSNKLGQIHPTTREDFTIQRSLILPPKSCGEDIMKAAIEWNNNALQSFFFGKKTGNPTFLFIVMYFWAKLSQLEYVQDLLPLMEDQLIYRLEHSYVHASLLGPDPSFPAKKVPLITAIVFTLYSVVHPQNPMIAHLPYADELIVLTELYGLPVSYDIREMILAHKLLQRIIKIFKINQGKMNPLLYLLRCYSQKVTEVEDAGILFDVLSLDGEVTEAGQEIVKTRLCTLFGVEDIDVNLVAYLVRLVHSLPTLVSHKITACELVPLAWKATNYLDEPVENWRSCTKVDPAEMAVPIDPSTGKPFPPIDPTTGELFVLIDPSTGMRFAITDPVTGFRSEWNHPTIKRYSDLIMQKWGQGHLSLTHIFCDLACSKKFGRFPTWKELLSYIWRKNIESMLTLQADIVLLCQSTCEDFLKAYPEEDGYTKFRAAYSG